MKRLIALLALSGALFSAVGCKSAFVDADITNNTGGQVTVFEVDYPSASFGRESVAAGTEFHYRFKVLGSGEVTASWIDAMGKPQISKGPRVWEGQQGSLTITLKPNGTAAWNTTLRPDK
jgi:hypothetical protein